MARIEWVHGRLQRWATWKTARDSRQGGFPKANILARWWQPPNNREPQARIPIDDAEAWETDRAVQELEPFLKETIEVFYLESSGTTAVAARLGIATATVKARIENAHRKLREVLDEAVREGRAPPMPGFMER